MLESRIDIINKISRTLSIIMCDIKLHQSLNDFSINIHAEDFFKDIFNALYDANYENANKASKNQPYIDLVDHHKQQFIQVTTTISSQKIEHSLNIFSDPRYQQYHLEIFYLLDKPKKLQQKTINKINDEHGIADIREHLKDNSDLLNDIKVLDDLQLQSIYRRFFASIEEKYTDEIVLQLVFESLLAAKKTTKLHFDDDFLSLETEDKFKLNKLNKRTQREIESGLDFSQVIENSVLEETQNDLRSLIVDEYYAELLKQNLRKYAKPAQLTALTIPELHNKAIEVNLCFDKVLDSLSQKIESHVNNTLSARFIRDEL